MLTEPHAFQGTQAVIQLKHWNSQAWVKKRGLQRRLSNVEIFLSNIRRISFFWEIFAVLQSMTYFAPSEQKLAPSLRPPVQVWSTMARSGFHVSWKISPMALMSPSDALLCRTFAWKDNWNSFGCWRTFRLFCSLTLVYMKVLVRCWLPEGQVTAGNLLPLAVSLCGWVLSRFFPQLYNFWNQKPHQRCVDVLLEHRHEDAANLQDTTEFVWNIFVFFLN